jgi:uncharacterized membrane protein YciS (DUF1049 family)
LVTLRRLAFAIGFGGLVLLAAVFAYSNPQPIDVDVGFARIEQISMATTFAVVFTLGWLVGLVTAGVALWRSAGDRRRLRKDLQYAEAELSTLRRTGLPDAN